uniref:Protein TIC 214 n=1 Tax=Droguetia iners TaxID=344765 RepID=A0A6B9TTS8_9ROSA|nr:hypothetical chloroplast RF19 [Droguetia iners]
MIFQSFILGNLVSLCIKIINSVVVVGLYYGFLTTFSIGPSYLFLLRARVMEEGEEGTEKKVSATTGFITGQLMMFISIYYVPLHLALGRPHTITVLALPYLLFHFFWNNDKHFFDYGSTNRNSMRNLSIQCVFLNNLIFQLFNHFILPSSMLVRLVNIYMFRCNNKMLFVTSSFVGWLIGHIFFMKWVGLVLLWIQQNNSIRSNKYLVSELRNFMARIFSILLFITCVYYLGRIPLTKETSEREESEEETYVETTSETKGTKQEQEGSTEEDPSSEEFLFKETQYKNRPVYETYYLEVDRNKENLKLERFKEKKDLLALKKVKETQYKNRPVYETYYLEVDRNKENLKLERFKEKKDLLRFEKGPLTNILDYKGWDRPARYMYIKNTRVGNFITFKNKMSQYFFHTCKSDGKERISFTYPSSLSTFFEMIQRKMSIFILKKLSPDELYTNWSYNNKEKRKNLNTKFLSRVKNLDRNSLILDVLEKKNRLCKLKFKFYKKKKEYFPKIYDPFLNSVSRGQKKRFSRSIENKISIQNYIERDWKNKIRDLFIINLEFEEKKNTFDRIDKKSLKKEISFLLNLINEFAEKPTSSLNLKKNYFCPEYKQVRKNLEGRKKKIKFILKRVQADTKNKHKKKKLIRLKEIIKKVPLENKELLQSTSPIYYSRKAKDLDDQIDYLLRYSQEEELESDFYFDEDIITNSIPAQKRKALIWTLFRTKAHSRTFSDQIDKEVSLSFDISEQIKKNFQNWLCKNTEFKDYTAKRAKESSQKKDEKKRREKARIETAEIWDRLIITQAIRGLLLLTQSIMRKYIILPSLIIVKNIGRILLFQIPEWSEDLKDWKREMHVKCTYNGVQLSEKKFPHNWLQDGIQIKILFPFRLKPWHKSKFKRRDTYNYPLKNKEKKNDFFFLTVCGMETEFIFGSPRKQRSFFEPILKELKKKLINLKKKCFKVLIILKERIIFFINISKEKWFLKNIQFIKQNKTKLSKTNQILLFGSRQIQIDELNKSKKEKTLIRNNGIIHESLINIESTNCTTFSMKKKKIQDLTDRRKTIINKIQTISKDNNKKLIHPHRNISFNKISYAEKRLELQKNLRELLKKKKKMFNYFVKQIIFVEGLYINTFLYINDIPRISAQLFFSFFFESTKKILNKSSSYNNEKKKNKSQFIYTLKESFFTIRNKNSKTFCDLSYLSQAYVFYKLSQNTVFNFYNLYKLKLRYIFQYNGTSLFLKNEIKDYFFGTHKIFHFDLKQKKLLNSGIQQCKNWLKGYYQNDLSQSLFVQKKKKNIVNQHFLIQKKHLNKLYSYEKKQLIYFEKKKKNVKKQHRYNLLSYNFIKYKKHSYIFGLPLQVNQNQSMFYNSNNHKRKNFNTPVGIPINNYLNYLVEIGNNIIDRKKNKDRKYFDWRFLNFRRRKKIDIGAWNNMDTDTANNKYSTIRTNNYKIIDKIDKKGLFDWMRMNEEMLSCPISPFALCFFPEFLILSNSYKIKSWYIPTKFLGNVNENVSENKNITVKKKRAVERDLTIDFLITSDLLFQLRWDDLLNLTAINNMKIYSLLVKLRKPKEVTMAYIQRGELSLDLLIMHKNVTFTELVKRGLFFLEPIGGLSIKKEEQFIMYQTIGISRVHKSKYTINQRYGAKAHVDKNNYDEFIPKHQKLTENRAKSHYDLFVPESILSPRRRRELRILICFYLKNRNGIALNAPFCNQNKVKSPILNKRKRDKNTLIKLKFFLWPNYRLEDFACLNRYWFDTNNGSRFSMVRTHMYPQLKNKQTMY